MTSAVGKTWRRDEYRDKLTGDLVAIEVSPERDQRDHISSEDCACIPTVKQSHDVLMLVHNSFDGREFTESNYREKSQ